MKMLTCFACDLNAVPPPTTAGAFMAGAAEALVAPQGMRDRLCEEHARMLDDFVRIRQTADAYLRENPDAE